MTDNELSQEMYRRDVRDLDTRHMQISYISRRTSKHNNGHDRVSHFSGFIPYERDTLKFVSDVFCSRFLLERESFFVLDKRTKTIDSSIYLADYKQEALALREKLLDGNVVVVKNLENYEHDIIEEIETLGNMSNLHMYVTPAGAESFGMHKDDRHVYINMLLGEKILVCLENGKEVAYHLKRGDWLYIPFGVEHRAVNIGKSISFSYGKIETDQHFVDEGLTVEDLEEIFGKE